MTTKKNPLKPQDLESFRKSIGLSAVVENPADGAYEFDDDVDPVPVEAALATIATELSAVEVDVAIVEAKYRAWKAVKTNDTLAKEPKLAEWKVRSKLEAEPTFIQTKTVLGDLHAVKVALVGFQTALINAR